jgi:hypothetical protein
MRWPVKICAFVCWVLAAGTLALWHGWGWGVFLVFAALAETEKWVALAKKAGIKAE